MKSSKCDSMRSYPAGASGAMDTEATADAEIFGTVSVDRVYRIVAAAAAVLLLFSMI